MTFKDLCTEVRALGFDSAEIEDSQLLISARRALGVIFTERCARSEIELFKLPSVFDERIPDFIHTPDGSERFELRKKAISFKTRGNGSLKITDAGADRIITFSGIGEHRYFLHGDAVIEFLGEYVYSVYDIALFSALLGESEDALPLYSEYECYDLKALAPDFSSALSQPHDSNGEPIKGAAVVGSKMKIPISYSGKVRLEYKRGAVKISGFGEEDISLPEGCEHLLPLLTAAYVWLDDDPEKAE